MHYFLEGKKEVKIINITSIFHENRIISSQVQLTAHGDNKKRCIMKWQKPKKI